MDGLEVRAQAAVDLARQGLLDGELALSYVLFPTEAIVAACRRCRRKPSKVE